MSDAHAERQRKRLLVLRNLLIGAGHFQALAALNFAQRLTTGRRKDGVTPAFDHQVGIALHAITLPGLVNPEVVLATIMLHDVVEDFGVSTAELIGIFDDPEVGGQVVLATDRVSKVFRGERRDETALFEAMSQDPNASIVKPCDRINNQGGMVGVFSEPKMISYVDETEQRILPMIKRAKRNFPRQTMAYENLAWTLKGQIALVRGLLPAADRTSSPAP